MPPERQAGTANWGGRCWPLKAASVRPDAALPLTSGVDVGCVLGLSGPQCVLREENTIVVPALGVLVRAT